MQYLREATASVVKLGPFLDDEDANTEETALTIANTDILLSKNGGTIAAKNSGGATHDADGWYSATFDATDTDTIGRLRAYVHVAGALMVWEDFQVLTQEAYDFLFGSSANPNGTVWDEILTGATHNIANSAGRRLRTLQTGGNYESGGVWLDTVNGTAGTTVDENGVVTNPVDTLADALTLLAATNLKRIFITPGSSLTLAAALENVEVYGADTPIALGGQSIDGSRFFDCELTGVSTGSAEFYTCKFGAATVGPCVIRNSGIGDASGTLTVGSAGDFVVVNCHSRVAGTAAPVIDMGVAVGATNMQVRDFSGGLTLNNLAAGDVVSVDVPAGGTVTLNGADATVRVSGNITALVNNLTGSPTVSADGVMNKPAINAEVLDVMNTDTITLPGQVAPPAAPTAFQLLGHLYKAFRNKKEQTATEFRIFNDAGTIVDQKSTTSDDGTTTTAGEIGSGP